MVTGALAVLLPIFYPKISPKLDLVSEGVMNAGEPISYWELLSRKRVFFAIMVEIINLVILTFLEPVLSLRLADFGVSASVTALFFAIPTVCYIFIAPFMHIISRKLENMTTM